MSSLGTIKKINKNIGTASAIRKFYKLIFESEPVDQKNHQRLRYLAGFTIEPDLDDCIVWKCIYNGFTKADLIRIKYSREYSLHWLSGR